MKLLKAQVRPVTRHVVTEAFRALKQVPAKELEGVFSDGFRQAYTVAFEALSALVVAGRAEWGAGKKDADEAVIGEDVIVTERG